MMGGIKSTSEFDSIHKSISTISHSDFSISSALQKQISLAASIKNPNPSSEFSSQLHHLSYSQLRMEAWKQAIDIQNNLNLGEEVRRSLKGLQLHNDMLKAISFGDSISDRVRKINESLQFDGIYLGEFDVVEEDEIEDSGLILPEEINEPLKNVSYIPIKLMQRIYDDPRVLKSIDPRDFEYLVADLVELSGFENVTVTPRSGDGGRDIIATYFVNEIPMLFAFECKKYSDKNKIKLETMRALLGTVTSSNAKANKGVLVTTSTFTSGAREFIASEPLIGGKDFNDLAKWIHATRNK